VPGAAFKITELTRSSAGAFVDTPRQFVWTAKEHSAPKDSWKFGIELRTSREDYPGCVIPSEQVLGWNFKPFTLTGRWDDRYMGAGKALSTYQAFEQLSQSGSMVRVEFEAITVLGIIKGAEFIYKRADYIDYSFEVSPHVRDKSAWQRPAPKGLLSPVPFSGASFAIINDMMILFSDLMALGLSLDLYMLILALLNELQRLGMAVEMLIQQQLYEADATEIMRRILHGFAAQRLKARELVAMMNARRASADLISQIAADVLTYEVVHRGLAYLGRTLVLNCLDAERALGGMVMPVASRLYRPHAGESLYAISERFYGKPYGWRLIAEVNGLDTIILTGAELLAIPDNGSA
jgi:nucleoid-associated protein YgaU